MNGIERRSKMTNSTFLHHNPTMSMYQPPTLPTLQGLPPLLNNAANSGAQEKINRELFVGNTPEGTPELLLQHFVNAAMRRAGLCAPHESPVLNARVNSKFAFVEMQSAEAANKCLNLNGIPFLTAFLKISRPSKYAGPPTPAVSWQQLTGQTSASVPDPETEKLQRELFIGNTTPEMTSHMLSEFLGNAMQQVGLTIAPGNPVTACRVSGKFAFVELRSAREAANALNLNNIPCMGTALRVGRPSKYNGPPESHLNWEDILAKYLSGELQPGVPGNAIIGTAAGATAASSVSTTTTPQSRIVELQNMLSADDLNNPDEYQDILDDTTEQCREFGDLRSVIIPRAHEVGATKIFLEYATVTDAAMAIQKLQGRTFDGRLVQATYFDEGRYANKDYA
jgi:RNA recognition motif. (a.k.a. RRM, RBD, or RNP domain)